MEIKAFQLRKGDTIIRNSRFEGGFIIGHPDNSGGAIEVTVRTPSGVEIVYYDYSEDVEIVPRD